MASRNSNNQLTFSFTYVDFLDQVNPKVYYASDRFFLTRDLLAMDPGLSVLTIDIDSIIMNPITIQEYDLGLSLNKKEITSGLSFFSDWSIDFIDDATKRMDKFKFLDWGTDRTSIQETYENYDISEVKFKNLTEIPLEDEKNIWTISGSKKYLDPEYVATFNSFNKKFEQG